MTTHVTLAEGEAARVGAVTVTFAGSGLVHFGRGQPPEGAVLLDVDDGGEPERLTLVGEGEFSATHTVRGLRIRVTTPHEARAIASVSLALEAETP